MTTGKLAEALAKAQGEMRGAKKDSENPFFKSAYADLASVWDACREALSKNELAVAQLTDILDGAMVLKTILMHTSGESLTGILPIQVGETATAQQIGSAITYARRYSLAAMVGVAPEDDDGQAAGQTAGKTAFKKAVPKESAIKDKATKLAETIDAARSELELTNIVTQANPMLAELKKELPDWFERIMTKISQTQEAFRLSETVGQ